MKYEIIDKVSRFVTRFGMIMDPETMNKARDEVEEYDFRLISGCGTAVHYAVIHGKKMYIIIERDGEIGCSCDAMTFNRMDGSACKHIIAFTRLMAPVTKKIDEADATHLSHVCGWTGAELHPEVELGGPGAVVQEDPKPTPKDRIQPDKDLDIGVNDPLPEPGNPDKVSVKCQYCKMGATRKDQEVADAWKEMHEATCSKNPDVGAAFSSDKIIPEDVSDKPLDDLGDRPEELKQKSEEETKMEDKPAWDQEAWDNATQGSFVSYGEDGIATVIFTANDFDIGEKPDKWGRTPFEFSVIQNKKSVILSVGAIGLMHSLKEILPLEGKLVKIIRTGEGTGTKYEVQDVTDMEVS